MESKGISWVACWYDDNWELPMFFEKSNEKTNWGELILEYLSGFEASTLQIFICGLSCFSFFSTR